jgi:hypothetical protein
MVFIGCKSIIIPSSHTDRPGMLCPSADGEDETVPAREPNGGGDVRRARATGDDRGASVDGAVPHPAHVVVAGTARREDLAGDLSSQLG